MSIKTYSELITIDSFKERLKYLSMYGQVGRETFGYDRWLNQRFYQSQEWRQLRHKIILRDNGCDLAFPGYEITDRSIYIHHMNPISSQDIVECTSYLLNPEYLVCVSNDTHNTIHFGTGKDLDLKYWFLNERSENDTCPWKKEV